MEVAGTAQVLLAVVLLVSAAAKARALPATTAAARALGVPARWARPTAVLLPPAELATAACLVLLPLPGVVASMVLLSAFMLVVAVALAQGRRPSCACFGGLGSAQVSGTTLARNGALLLAGTAALVAGPARPPWSAVLTGAALAAGLLALEVADGRRGRARELAVLEASLGTSTPAPDFTAVDLSGRPVRRADLLAPGRPLLLVLLSPGCSSCVQLVPVLRRWQQAHGDTVTLAVAVNGDADAAHELLGAAETFRVLLDPEAALADALGVLATPAAVLLTRIARQVGGAASGGPGVRRLLEAALDAADAGPVDASALTLSFVPVPAAGVRVLPDDDGALLVDELTGAELHVDRLGAVIWSVLDGQAPAARLAAELAEAFGAPLEQVEADLLQLLRALGAAGLLDGVRAVEQDSYR